MRRKNISRFRAILIPVFLNTIIFAFLSLLHFYWAFGGRLWYNEVLPTSSNGLHRMNPGKTATLLIAFGLLFLALVTAGNTGWFNSRIKKMYLRYGALIIAIIFLLRAIGDFKFTGFFKKVKGTTFAINDTQIFSPLCLFIAMLSLLIYILNGKVSAANDGTRLNAGKKTG